MCQCISILQYIPKYNYWLGTHTITHTHLRERRDNRVYGVTLLNSFSNLVYLITSVTTSNQERKKTLAKTRRFVSLESENWSYLWVDESRGEANTRHTAEHSRRTNQPTDRPTWRPTDGCTQATPSLLHLTNWQLPFLAWVKAYAGYNNRVCRVPRITLIG